MCCVGYSVFNVMHDPKCVTGVVAALGTLTNRGLRVIVGDDAENGGVTKRQEDRNRRRRM